MTYFTIVLLSLLLQCAATYYSFRLITLTGHTRAWLLLSAGIATMAARRFITLLTLFPDHAPHQVAVYSFEIIGVFGSAMMLAGVVAIKPIFILLRDAKEEQRALAESLQDALDKVKVLSGMLPICANCKKIRDDDGYWQNVESYIARHSDTKFSHSICPDCIRKLYPELSEAILKKLEEGSPPPPSNPPAAG